MDTHNLLIVTHPLRGEADRKGDYEEGVHHGAIQVTFAHAGHEHGPHGDLHQEARGQNHAVHQAAGVGAAQRLQPRGDRARRRPAHSLRLGHPAATHPHAHWET